MSQWHPYGIIDPSTIVEEADKVLNEFVKAAEDLDIKYFLWAGTCLGFVRDGSYIKGDNDIDVAVICDSQKLKELFETLAHVYGFNRGTMYPVSCHFYKNRVLLDITFKLAEKKGPFFMDFMETSQTVLYKGKKYNVPSPVEDYLKVHFGDSWRIPTGDVK